MVESPVVYAAVVLLLAGVFPAVAARYPARLFEVLPPIVLAYAASTALAMAGCWRAAPGIDGVRTAILAHLLPALVFLMLVRCDLRAVAALGPRVLGAAACSTLSIIAGVIVAWLLWRPWLTADGWQVLASLGATWIGGTANLVAVSRAIDSPADTVSLALVADTVCYTGGRSGWCRPTRPSGSAAACSSAQRRRRSPGCCRRSASSRPPPGRS